MGSIDVGVVLAGGRSERMGTAKAEVTFGGETFLERAVDLLRSRFSNVIVSGGDHPPAGATVLPDRNPHRGPLGGIASALAFAERDVFVMPVDVPLLTIESIDRLADRPLLAGQVRVARADGRVHPLVGSYPFDQLGRIEQRLDSDDRSVIGLLRSVPVLTLVDVESLAVTDVNTPDDLDRLSGSH